jgi:hypothetical protein
MPKDRKEKFHIKKKNICLLEFWWKGVKSCLNYDFND